MEAPVIPQMQGASKQCLFLLTNNPSHTFHATSKSPLSKPSLSPFPYITLTNPHTHFGLVLCRLSVHLPSLLTLHPYSPSLPPLLDGTSCSDVGSRSLISTDPALSEEPPCPLPLGAYPPRPPSPPP